jgi:hypothetical protein
LAYRPQTTLEIKANRYARTRAAWQLSAVGRKDYVTPDDIRVAPALTLLAQLV